MQYSQSQKWYVDYPCEKDEVVSFTSGDMSGKYNFSIGARRNQLTEEMFPIALCIDENGNYKDRIFDDNMKKGMFCYAQGIGEGRAFVVARCTENDDAGIYEQLWVSIIDSDLEILQQKHIDIEYPYISFGTVKALVNDNKEFVVVAQVIGGAPSSNNVVYDYAFYKIDGGCKLLKYSYLKNTTYNNVITDFTLRPNTNQYAVVGNGMSVNGMETVFYIDDDLNYVSTVEIDNTNDYSNYMFPKFMDVGHWIDDNHFLMSAQTSNTSGKNEWCPIVLKMDSDMNILERLDLERVDATEYVSQHRSMAYIDANTIYVSTYCAGDTDFSDFLPNTASIYLINEELELLGKKEININDFIWLLHIQPTYDKGCIIQASIVCNTHEKPFICKLDKSDFEEITNVLDYEVTSIVDVFPNPVSSILYIDVDNQDNKKMQVEIVDVLGRRCREEDLGCDNDVLQIDVSQLKRGVYCCHIKCDGYNVKKMFIKE